jgi:hypothetical protein
MYMWRYGFRQTDRLNSGLILWGVVMVPGGLRLPVLSTAPRVVSPFSTSRPVSPPTWAEFGDTKQLLGDNDNEQVIIATLHGKSSVIYKSSSSQTILAIHVDVSSSYLRIKTFSELGTQVIAE